MNSKKIKTMTLAALLAAFACVATMLIQVPTPTKGYVNLGDCIVNISAWLLGPVYGAAAAGIGSAMADVISGYIVYAPATLIIKGLMAAASFFVYRAVSKKAIWNFRGDYVRFSRNCSLGSQRKSYTRTYGHCKFCCDL